MSAVRALGGESALSLSRTLPTSLDEALRYHLYTHTHMYTCAQTCIYILCHEHVDAHLCHEHVYAHLCHEHVYACLCHGPAQHSRQMSCGKFCSHLRFSYLNQCERARTHTHTCMHARAHTHTHNPQPSTLGTYGGGGGRDPRPAKNAELDYNKP